jgi:hypothetical protein
MRTYSYSYLVSLQRPDPIYLSIELVFDHGEECDREILRVSVRSYIIIWYILCVCNTNTYNAIKLSLQD